MKKLMRDQRLKPSVAIFSRKPEPLEPERGRIQMFQPAAGVRSQMQNEGVVVIGNTAEHRRLSFDDLQHVGAQTLGIIVALAVDHDSVRDTADLKVELLEIADFKRRIVKNVEVLGPKSIRLTWRRRQAGSDLPAGWRDDTQSRWHVEVSRRIHQQRRIVPERMVRIQLAGAHRELIGIDAIGSPPLARAASLHPPGVLVYLRPVQ